MPYEHRHQPILRRQQWRRRIYNSLGFASIIVGGALSIGVVGYHLIGGLPWIDAFLEASMILGGMGAVAPMHTDAVKIFAAFYALLSGFVVISTTGVVLAPWLHRILHQFHIDEGRSDVE